MIPQYAIDTMKAAGYRVFMPTDPAWKTYAFFEKDNRVGYVECDRFHGFKLSTVHVPNRTSGTGYRLTTEPVGKLTPELLHQAATTSVPAWASRTDPAPRKYASVAECLGNRANKFEEV